MAEPGPDSGTDSAPSDTDAPRPDTDTAVPTSSHASTATAIPYHRLAHHRGLRVLVEPVLVVVLFLIAAGIVFEVTRHVAGVRKIDELGRFASTAMMFIGLALLIPCAMLAAKAGGRAPGLLSSVAGRLRWRWLLQCVGLALVSNLVATFGYAILTELLGNALGLADEPDKEAWVGWASFLPMLALVLVLVPLQAAGEEYVTRGTLVQTVGAFTRSPWPAIVISGFVFSLIHMTNLDTSGFIFVMGAVTAWLTIQTGGLEAAIAEHTINNVLIFVVVAAIAPEQLDQSDLNAGAEVGPMVSQSAGVLLYAALVLRRYRRICHTLPASPA